LPKEFVDALAEEFVDALPEEFVDAFAEPLPGACCRLSGCPLRLWPLRRPPGRPALPEEMGGAPSACADEAPAVGGVGSLMDLYLSPPRWRAS
jgi:hypothetical protein